LFRVVLLQECGGTDEFNHCRGMLVRCSQLLRLSKNQIRFPQEWLGCLVR
jgi:hypothetical protein